MWARRRHRRREQQCADRGSLKVFGSLAAVEQDREACGCSLEVVAIPVPRDDDDGCEDGAADGTRTAGCDPVGFRLPLFASDANRIHRCRALGEAAWDLFPQAVAEAQVDDAVRQCSHAGNASPIVSLAANASGVHPATVRKRMERWFAASSKGAIWIEAMRRTQALERPGAQREFRLQKDEAVWAGLLPSEAAQRASPDVNTFRVQLPKRHASVRTLIAPNARVERNGRVVTEAREVFYPKRAPYSHISLMEKFTNKDKTVFVPELESRKRFLADETAMSAALAKCRDTVVASNASGGLGGPADDGKIHLCGSHDRDALLLGVDTVLVLSQTLADQMFHFFCEVLPRIGPYLRFLEANPSVFVHAACDSAHASGYCFRVFELMGIHEQRLLRVRGNGDGQTSKRVFVVANTVVVPEGGRRHWPLSNIWGILAVRARLLGRNDFGEDANGQCSSNAAPKNNVRLLIVKRHQTRLALVTYEWYDRLASELKEDAAFPVLLSATLDVRFLDDHDKVTMGDVKRQIQLIRWADVVVGAHGAGFALMMFAKTCTHFVSFRSRVNSDVFEHLALGLGIPFHHVRFDNSYAELYKDVRTSVGNAILMLRPPSRDRYCAVMLCDSCSREALEEYSRLCRRVIARGRGMADLPANVVVMDAYDTHPLCAMMQNLDAPKLLQQDLGDGALVVYVAPNTTLLLDEVYQPWMAPHDLVAFAQKRNELWPGRALVAKLSLLLQAGKEWLCGTEWESPRSVIERLLAFPRTRTVALVLSPFSSSMLFSFRNSVGGGELHVSIPPATRDRVHRLALEMDDVGPHALFQPAWGEEDEEFCVLVVDRETVLAHYFPAHVMVREAVHATTILATNEFIGNVLFVRVPFAPVLVPSGPSEPAAA